MPAQFVSIWCPTTRSRKFAIARLAVTYSHPPSKIEKLAEELAGALERTIPEQYLAERKTYDRLGRLWYRASDGGSNPL